MNIFSVRLCLILLCAQLCLPAAASGAARPDRDASYMRADFREVTSNPEKYEDRRVCVKGGLIRRDILVDVDQLNRPYTCTFMAAEKFDPKLIENGAKACIAHYGRHIHPRLELWFFPEDTGIEPETCVVVCGVFREGDDVHRPFEVERVEPCK